MEKDRCTVSQRPDLIKEWDFELNTDLSPDEVSIGSNKKAWWRCEKGHSWEAIIGNRSRWSGCPYCSGRRVCLDNCLATLYPSVAKDWDYEKNGKITPQQVTCGSTKKAWWRCEKGHSWEATIASRTKGSGCPICQNHKCLKGYNDLQTVFPNLIVEWDYEKNYEVKPDELVYSTETKIWWKCSRNHSWNASVYSRSISKNGCPYCAGIYTTKENSLAANFPRIAELWDYEKNSPLTPEMVSKYSGKKVFWKCDMGHSWNAVVSDLTSLELGCPYCSGKRASAIHNLAVSFPELLVEWDYEKNLNIRPEQVTPHSQRKVWWKCEKGHSWEAVIGNRTTNRTGCPMCNNRSTSFPEQALLYYCEQLFDEVISRDVESIGVELDIFIPTIQTAIEYDGFLWHNASEVIKKDVRKDKLCIGNNIRLIRVIETGIENLHSPEIICFYVKKSNYSELSRVIKNVLVYLVPNNDIEVDVQRDINVIKERYLHIEKENSFAGRYPAIANQWDSEKNGELSPFLFSPGSSHKAWWKCDKGHNWQAQITTRVSGRGCPYCAKKLASKENNLEVLFPAIAKEWNYEKNKGLYPRQMTPFTPKKVWWRCERNHEWLMSVSHRTKDNCNCPFCSGRRASADNNLEIRFPAICNEWDYEKNGDVLPQTVTQGSEYIAWWKCPKGHSYDMQICRRTKMGHGCPYCAGKRVAREDSFGSLFPKLLSEWDLKKNEISPFDILPHSQKKVWWRCSNNHSYEARLSNKITHNSQCPYCAGRKVCADNCLAVTCQEVAEQWDYGKNGELTPKDVTKGSQKSVWWKCEYGHEWEDTIFHRTRTKTHPCPICRTNKGITM